MHPYMSEKLAASHRDDLLAAADRHRQAVHARRSQTGTTGRGAAVRTIIASAVAALLRAAMSRSSGPTARAQSSDCARPAPW